MNRRRLIDAALMVVVWLWLLLLAAMTVPNGAPEPPPAVESGYGEPYEF